MSDTAHDDDLVHEPRKEQITVVLYRSARGEHFTATAQPVTIAELRRHDRVLAEHTFEIEE